MPGGKVGREKGNLLSSSIYFMLATILRRRDFYPKLQREIQVGYIVCGRTANIISLLFLAMSPNIFVQFLAYAYYRSLVNVYRMKMADYIQSEGGGLLTGK